MKYFGTALTDIGISKHTNQDSVCLKIVHSKEVGQVALMIVCDGMGGLQKGELASATVITRLADWFDKELPLILKSATLEWIAGEWEQLIKRVNRQILDYGSENHVSLGTTLTAMLIMKEKYMIVHVGDSRIYRITEQVEQLTEDQTVVEREVRLGNMTPEEAEVDARRNMLLQCVGASRVVKPVFYYGNVCSNDIYIACSDGFRHMLSQKEIQEHFNAEKLQTKADMTEEGKKLIELVKRRNERDNISVAFIKCVE